MSDIPGTQPPPGWYPDPQNPSMLRWWDGHQWTNDIRPLGAAAPPTAAEGRLRPIGDWLTETFRLLVNNAGSLFTLVVILIVPAALVSAVGVWFGIRNVIITFNEDAASDEFPVSFAGFEVGAWWAVAAAVLVNLVLSLVFGVAGTRLAISDRFGTPMNWSQALSSGFRRFLPWLGWAIVGAIAVLIVLFVAVAAVSAVTVIVPALGVVLGLLVFVVGGLILYGRYGMIFTSPMIAEAGYRSPLVVHRITKHATWGLIGRTLLLVLITMAASLAGTAITGPLGSLGGGETLEPGADVIRVADIVGGNMGIFMLVQLMNAVIGALTVLIWHVGMALLFDDLGGQVDQELRDRPQRETAPTFGA